MKSLKFRVLSQRFHRYLDVLIQLTRVDGTRHGRLIASQMMDVTIRVKAIRSYAVQVLVRLRFLGLVTLSVCGQYVVGVWLVWSICGWCLVGM